MHLFRGFFDVRVRKRREEGRGFPVVVPRVEGGRKGGKGKKKKKNI